MSRILIATLLGLAGFAVYVVVALALADRLAPVGWVAQLGYFLVAGVLWVFPIWWLMLWAARGRQESSQ